MFDPHAYTITVKKVRVDDEEQFRATVAEFPDVEEYADSYQEAYELAVDAIETLRSAYTEEARQFPAPIGDETEFSGRITLRIPRSVHRRAAAIAKQEDVSLNQWLTSVVAESVGASTATAKAQPKDRIPRGLFAISEGTGGKAVINARVAASGGGVLSTGTYNDVILGASFGHPAAATRPGKRQRETA
jgi:predicted HicB family RNase H-like nuclease